MNMRIGEEGRKRMNNDVKKTVVVDNNFDADVETYNANMAAQLGADYEKFAKYKVELLKFVVQDQVNSILNYGCGVGNDMRFFKESWPDAKLYGCDISQKSVEYAAKVAPDINYFVSDSTDKIYEQCTKWDVVFLAGVLHHIPPAERTAWIQSIGDNVRPGGYIAVFEHNILNPMTRHIVTHPIEDPPLDKLEWMLNLKEIEKLLLGSHNGMKTYWKGYTLFSPFRRGWITKMETFMKWCPIGAQQCVIVKKEA